MSIDSIYESVLDGDAGATADAVKDALEAGVLAEDILHNGCIAAMNEVGRQFEAGDKFVPEMLISARAMQAAMMILKPHLLEADIQALGKVVMGTVKGDLHDIGKNLVSMMMEGAGFEVIDLGTDAGPESFVAAVRDHAPQIVGMSSLLTTTMLSMQATVEALDEAGLRDQVKILVGGAPVTQAFAEKIGADGYAPDASAASRIAKQLLGNA